MAPKTPGDFLDNGIDRAHAHGRASATHDFITGLNPKFRGPKWSWGEFQNQAARMAEASAHSSFSDEEWDAWSADITEAVRSSAKAAAQRLLSESGLLEWWSEELAALQKKG